jgi:hypothetical protein
MSPYIAVEQLISDLQRIRGLKTITVFNGSSHVFETGEDTLPEGLAECIARALACDGHLVCRRAMQPTNTCGRIRARSDSVRVWLFERGHAYELDSEQVKEILRSGPTNDQEMAELEAQ